MRRPCPTGGCRAKNKQIQNYWTGIILFIGRLSGITSIVHDGSLGVMLEEHLNFYEADPG
jgi:hypothetical protein